MRPNATEQIGTLVISESYRQVRNLLARNLAADLLSELIKTAGLAALLFIIIYRSVTRHLQALAREVSNLTPGNVPTPITLQRKVRHDELDTLVDSINRFRGERADVEDALLRDITERKRVETTLHKTEGDLSEALQIAQLAYWQYDTTTRAFTLNDHFYSLLRTTVGRVGGYRMLAKDAFERLVHGEDASAFAAYIQKAERDGQPEQLSRSAAPRSGCSVPTAPRA
jgi:PAS domain-containing protein